MKTLIEKIAEDKLVEDLVREIGRSESDFNLDDLIQDIYLDLWTKKDKVNEIPENQIRYYIARIVINNIHSRTSPYYKTYKKHTDYDELEGYNDRLPAD